MPPTRRGLGRPLTIARPMISTPPIRANAEIAGRLEPAGSRSRGTAAQLALALSPSPIPGAAIRVVVVVMGAIVPGSSSAGPWAEGPESPGHGPTRRASATARSAHGSELTGTRGWSIAEPSERTPAHAGPSERRIAMIAIDTMRANVFRAPGEYDVTEVARPRPGPGEALIRVTLTTICGTDVHIVKGEYPVQPGLVLGHEPVGVIEELGAGVVGYEVGDRVLVGAITPCGQCHACLSRPPLAVRPRVGLRGDRRLAVRQHDRRRAGRVPRRAVGAGQPRDDPGRRHRRAGRPARRHRLDRLRRARSRAASASATPSSSSPRARSASARRPARS